MGLIRRRRAGNGRGDGNGLGVGQQRYAEAFRHAEGAEEEHRQLVVSALARYETWFCDVRSPAIEKVSVCT